MTTVSFIQKTCSVCGSASRQPDFGIQGLMEPSDLDSRPGGSQRSSIYLWIQCCASCGYCAPDISKQVKNSKETIETELYRQRLNNKNLPETINHFLCWSMILEAAGENHRAGWASLYAAWVCDDDPEVRKLAPDFRRQACRLFEKARLEGKRFAVDNAEEEIIIIDLLRRCSDFDEAGQSCGKMLSQENAEEIVQIVVFQQELIAAKDTRKHTINEALEHED